MNFIQKIKSAISYYQFIQDFRQFKTLSHQSGERFQLNWAERYPCIYDRTSETGFDRHYIYHPAWAARVLAQTKPALHIDISSTLYFCSIISAFIPLRFYDYRPANLEISKLTCRKADLLCLPFEDASIESLSCMHVVEHIGLGRYGDPLDSKGDIKAISELRRVMAQGGSLLFVVPIGGIPRIMFNAHRIYSYKQIVEYFADLELMQFALIPDEPNLGGLILDASEELADMCSYGCGCFWFRRA